MNSVKGTPAPRSKGIVVSFMPRKGYGFVRGEAEEQLFVHFSDIRGRGFRTLEPGEEVEYTRAESERGPQAKDVVRLNPPAPSAPVSDQSEPGRTW